MTKSILKLIALALLATVIAGLPVCAGAADTSAPAKESKAKKPAAIPFHGKLTAVDSTAKTITVGKRTFQITSETKISKKSDIPAMLEDGVVGDNVSGAYKKAEDGKLVATTVKFGATTEKAAARKAKAKME